MSDNGKNNYNKFKNKKNLKIGVIGNANKGKSFILSKISKIELPSGMSIKTEGLSVKYPELEKYKDRKIVLLDSAGLETPVLISKEMEEKNKNDKENDKKNSKKNDIKNDKENKIKNDKENDEENKIFKEKCREKLITELFLQNYIIHNSDILIIVVDALSFSEQKLLMKIIKETERAKRAINIYVIHNLKTYTSKDQIKDYIENTLLKSATFSLEPGHGIRTSSESKTGIYFCEKDGDKKPQKIFHLIFANENSEAGKFYNQFTLDFIENSYLLINNLKPYDVIESIKDRYIQVSEDIIEKSEENQKITEESFDNSDPKLIKLKNVKEITLKKCFIDELGFSNLKPNGFEPKYNIFKKDNKIIIRIETPGNCNIKAEKASSDKYNIIKLSGEKTKDSEPEKDGNIHSIREFGHFYLEIPLSKEFNLSKEHPTYKQIKGLSILEYKLEKEEEPIEFRNEDII